MTEQELRTGLARSLAGADLPECRKRDILAHMKGEAPMKKRVKLSAVLALAALLAALTATAAVASGFFRGTVNWNAQPTQDMVSAAAQPAPMPTATPPSMAAPEQTASSAAVNPVNTIERITAVQTLLAEEAAAAQGDLILLTEQGGQPGTTLTNRRSATARMTDVADYAQLQALLNGSPLPLPASLPDGYEITAMRVERNCLTEGRYTLRSVTERTLALDGSRILVHRYAADPEHDAITGYHLTLTSPTGDTILIIASLAESSENQGFGLWDDEAATPASVPGMDNALLICGSARTQLFLRRSLSAPMSVVSLLYPDAADSDGTELLTELFIRINANALDGDALLALFSK